MEITAQIKITEEYTIVYCKKSDKNYITKDFKTFNPLSQKQLVKIFGF